MKIKKILTHPYLYYVILLMLGILFYLFELNEKLNAAAVAKEKYFLVFLIVAIIISVGLFLLINFVHKKKWPIHKVFLVLALSLGSIYLVLSPLFTGSDEHAHYYRIYEISDGILKTEVHNQIVGSNLPESLAETFTNGVTGNAVISRNKNIKYQDELDMAQIALDKDNKTLYGRGWEKEYPNTALYSPIQYLPQVVAFSMAKAMDLGPFWIGYIGRIFTLLTYVIIGTIALKYLPRLKIMALLILLSPSLLVSATTLSADSFTNILIFAFISFILYFRYEEKKISLKMKVLLVLLSLLIASCKIVYLPFLLLLFLLKADNFQSKKEKNIFVSIVFLLGCIINLIWMGMTDIYFETYYQNTKLQESHILSNILGYFIVVLRTYMNQTVSLALNMFGGSELYSANLPIYPLISLAYLVLVFLAFFCKEQKKKYEVTNLRWHGNTLVILVLLATLALLTTAIYIQCTATFIKVDNPVVIGLQGRYYLPLILGLFILLKKDKLKIHFSNANILIGSSIVVHFYFFAQMLVNFLI